jgi:hypothetical protein
MCRVRALGAQKDAADVDARPQRGSVGTQRGRLERASVTAAGTACGAGLGHGGEAREAQAMLAGEIAVAAGEVVVVHGDGGGRRRGCGPAAGRQRGRGRARGHGGGAREVHACVRTAALRGGAGRVWRLGLMRLRRGEAGCGGGGDEERRKKRRVLEIASSDAGAGAQSGLTCTELEPPAARASRATERARSWRAALRAPRAAPRYHAPPPPSERRHAMSGAILSSHHGNGSRSHSKRRPAAEGCLPQHRAGPVRSGAAEAPSSLDAARLRRRERSPDIFAERRSGTRKHRLLMLQAP